MNQLPRIKKLFIVSSCLGILGFALTYYLINEKFEWIPKQVLEAVRQPELLQKPEAKRCSECHQAIYEAWKESRHSISWTSETYIEASENRTKEKCLACHIPQSVQGDKPTPRLDRRDEGIYCVSCHFTNNKMHGPYDLLAPPHPTHQNPDYESSKLCGSCHEKTFKQWQATKVEDTCQSCHMPRTKKRLTQKFGLNLLHKKRWVGDHRFLRGEITKSDIILDTKFEEKTFILSLLNKTIPHAVPTADNGDPRLYLYVSFFNEAGDEVDKSKEIIAPQQETALPYGEKVEYRYRLFEKVARAQVELKYKSVWTKDKTNVWKHSVSN